MATLTVSVSTNYSALPLIDVTLIDFTNLVPRVLATATFSSLQFNDVQIQSNVSIDGSAGRNGITVNGGSLDASGWIFSNWAASDLVTLNGSANPDTLLGSTQKDTINGLGGGDELIGGLGLDKLFGGEGDDEFRYLDEGELVAGEVVNGGAGVDWLILDGLGEYRLDLASISGVEKLQIESEAVVRLTSKQIGPGGIAEIVGNLIPQAVKISGQAVDMSVLTFTGWDDVTDDIYVSGVEGSENTLAGSVRAEQFFGGDLIDTITGGGGDDAIFGRDGSDILDGGQGNDSFIYSPSGIDDGEIVNGGEGVDSFDIIKGTCELWRLDVSSVEQVKFSFFGSGIEVAGNQIGAQAGQISVVIGSTTAPITKADVTVLGPVADLTGVSFTNWSVLHTITLLGQVGAVNTLTGSALADKVVGGDLGDTLKGGKGVDTIIGGLGKDSMTGGNQGDYFLFLSAADSGIANARDLITDFSVGNDIIDLSAIDALAGGGDDIFTYLGEAAAFTGAGQVRFQFSDAGNTIIRINLDADQEAEMEIGLLGLKALTIDEFIL